MRVPAGLDVNSGGDAGVLNEKEGAVPQTQALSKLWAPASSGPIAVPGSSSKRVVVPKLMLPTSHSPGALIGELLVTQHVALACYILETYAEKETSCFVRVVT